MKAGFSIKTYRLEGVPGDGLDLDRARQCRALTRELLEWWDGEQNSGRTPGTWGWVAQRYLSDDFSPYREKKGNTQKSYREQIDQITAGIGEVEISETDFERLSLRKSTMQKNGRSVAYIKRCFLHFGLLISYAVQIGGEAIREDAKRVRDIRSEMRIKNPPKRTRYLLREQMEQIVRGADDMGQNWSSLALLFRFETLLRGNDVYGQWIQDDGTGGGIRYKGKVWVDGITWEEIDRDIKTLTHVPYKTQDTSSDPIVFDLTQLPEIRTRLQKIPHEARVGPVIILNDELPPRRERTTKVFKKHVHAIREQQIA